jgi:hypothetical protein
MDRALVAVLGAAVGCGVLLAVAVAKNERSFTQRLYAENPAVVETAPASVGRQALAPSAAGALPLHPLPAAPLAPQSTARTQDSARQARLRALAGQTVSVRR